MEIKTNYYEVEITKIVDGKKVEYLVGAVKDLEELVGSIACIICK